MSWTPSLNFVNVHWQVKTFQSGLRFNDVNSNSVTNLLGKESKRSNNHVLEQTNGTKKAGPTSTAKDGFGPATYIVTINRRLVRQFQTIFTTIL